MMLSQKFDEDLLQAFMQGFYGYGNFEGEYWFVGMEEGGGNSFHEVDQRFEIWDSLGRGELLDVAQFHLKLGMPEFFTEPVKLQSTWNKVIRIILSAEGEKVSLSSVRKYQRDDLGRRSGNSCLIELLPLPSPSTKKWLYAEHTDLPFLRNREAYRDYAIPWRIEGIRERIEKYRPSAVVFYGMVYQEWWREIADLEFKPFEQYDFLVANSQATKFIMSKHPVAMGVTNEYFHQIGRAISEY
jgi:hypothetical protein